MEKEELYKIAIETRNMEIGLFWQRSNYFLVLNTAVAVGFFSIKSVGFQVLLALFGIVVSLLWFGVNLGSKYWQSRWEHRASVIESEIGSGIEMFSASKSTVDADVKASLLNHKFKPELDWYDKLVMKKPSVSKYMSILASLFIFLWIGVLIISACSLVIDEPIQYILDIGWENVV
ncbi:hypothetical protein F2K82_17900 [Vibrio cholerae]|nr:hypothetical protein [Vibrio cholerae]EGQ9639249.1 hypothetical protein [Vibrio cholerae]EGZ6883157.1 hypothetical protein [Vibrio cholerae]EKF9186653.1 hypothetical protein [Vibrio cholerae]GHY59717.1 membrane protein [Vibrio cholerae]